MKMLQVTRRMTSGRLVHSLNMQRLSRFRQSEFTTLASRHVRRMNNSLTVLIVVLYS